MTHDVISPLLNTALRKAQSLTSSATESAPPGSSTVACSTFSFGRRSRLPTWSEFVERERANLPHDRLCPTAFPLPLIDLS